jgi:hypothetical protein
VGLVQVRVFESCVLIQKAKLMKYEVGGVVEW